MAEQVLVVGGTDLTGYVKVGGFKWSRNDIDAANSGRDKSGNMRRARVASKAKLQVSLRKLTHAQMLAVNQAIYPETVSVTYLDPRVGRRTATFYGSSVDAATAISQDGDTIWEDGSFSLVEV